MKGWVYVITNNAMPGLIKVGYSMKDPELRAAELYHTGSPHPYVVDYEVLVEEPRAVEQTVHLRLRNQREGKEWFRCTAEEAIAAIKVVVGGAALVENFKRADRAKSEAIKLQREADERLTLAAEEERLRRESVLDSKRQEIVARYEPLLDSALPANDFWTLFFYCFLTFFPTWFLGSFLLGLRNEGFLWPAFFISIPIGFMVKSHFREKAKESAKYKGLIAERDAELAAIESER